MKYEDLSEEQQLFINYGVKGFNILVEACIGSGKTTPSGIKTSFTSPITSC